MRKTPVVITRYLTSKTKSLLSFISNSFMYSRFSFRVLLHNIIHLIAPHEGNICVVSRESLCFPKTKLRKTFDSRETKQIYPEGAIIKCFVIQHKQNISQLLKQIKFITRMRVEIQTYNSPCGVLSVYGVFFYKEFSNFIFCKMSKAFLWGFHFVLFL